MVHTYLDQQQPKSLREALGAELACRTHALDSAVALPWQDFRFGQAQANTLLRQNQAAWSQYVPIDDPNKGFQVTTGTKVYTCNIYDHMM